MKLYLILLALVAITLAEDDLHKCKCPHGFEARKGANDVVMCYGILLKSIMPCSLILKPKCQCGPGVTGIIHDGSGTWCGAFGRGREQRRWRCENTEEWDQYYSQHNNIRPRH